MEFKEFLDQSSITEAKKLPDVINNLNGFYSKIDKLISPSTFDTSIIDVKATRKDAMKVLDALEALIDKLSNGDYNI